MADFWKTQANIDRYNQKHAVQQGEIERYLGHLSLTPSDSFVDFGCGKGDFLLAAADQVRTVLGIDATPAQIEEARQAVIGKPNVEVMLADFLSFDPGERRFTKGSARKSLHHLTDSEKKTFCRKIGACFEGGSLFVIEDGMYPFPKEELENRMPEILEEASRYYGERWETIRTDLISTMREEYPTGHRVWEEALDEGGFDLVSYEPITSFYGRILARKRG